jgi:hypothetical protein
VRERQYVLRVQMRVCVDMCVGNSMHGGQLEGVGHFLL